MMKKELKLHVVPKEEAVFWMDIHGRWHNEHGKIEHPKIIDYFHSAIQRDEDGYFLQQEFNGIREKVYFPYEETARFVFDVKFGEGILLLLNTKQKISLIPEDLYVKDDQLYMEFDGDKVKFTENALLKLADCFHQKEDGYFFSHNGKEIKISD